MTEPLAPLDDELDLWLAPARPIPEVSEAHTAAALAGVQRAIALTPAPAVTLTGTAPGANPWWFAGGGLAVGLLVGAGAMWAFLDAPAPEPQALVVETAEPAPLLDSPALPELEPRETRETELELAAPLPAEPTLRRPTPVATPPDEPEATEPEEAIAAAPRESTLVDERRIVDAALAQVSRGNPAAALASVARHESSFPSGQLTEAREIVRIRALAALGRMQEAQQALARFRTRFPRSAAASSLAELVAQ